MIGLAIAVRFVHLAALMLLTGAVAFVLLVARPAFQRAGGAVAADYHRLDRTALRLAAWSLAAVVASAVAWLWVQAAVVAGRPLAQAATLDTLAAVLGRTEFGRGWQVRLALAGLVGGLLLLRGRERDERDWWAIRGEIAVLVGTLLATLAWAGHAAATEGGLRLLHLAADALHLGAAGIWLGGLVPLALLLARVQRSAGDLAWAAVGREAVRRFSALGLISVVTLVATGLVNGWILVGDFPPLVGTPYGRMLLLKLVLLLPLLGLAALNRLKLKPRLVAMAATATGLSSVLLRRLRDHVIAEAALGASILLIVGALGTVPPAQHLQPFWPFAFRLSWDAMKDVPGVRFGLTAGGCLVALGMLVVLYGLVRRRHRAIAVVFGAAAVVYYAPASLSLLAVDAYPTTYLRPPVPYHALSVANGARLYAQHCAVCHGAGGHGDGPGAAGLLRDPADLTAKHTADHTAGDLFWWLTYGIQGTPMPGFRHQLSEEDRWDSSTSCGRWPRPSRPG